MGHGSYGNVVKVEENSTGNLFAMKIINKRKIDQVRTYSHVKMRRRYQIYNERDMLTKLRSPFILRLRKAFQADGTLYFLTDLCERGELTNLLDRVETNKLDKNTARFVIAELVQTLDYLHSSGVAHRDLKPANIFITKEGHLKLVSNPF